MWQQFYWHRMIFDRRREPPINAIIILRNLASLTCLKCKWAANTFAVRTMCAIIEHGIKMIDRTEAVELIEFILQPGTVLFVQLTSLENITTNFAASPAVGSMFTLIWYFFSRNCISCMCLCIESCGQCDLLTFEVARYLDKSRTQNAQCQKNAHSQMILIAAMVVTCSEIGHWIANAHCVSRKSITKPLQMDRHNVCGRERPLFFVIGEATTCN